MELKHIKQSNIRIYDNIFDYFLDFNVDNYSWEEIIELISIKQDLDFVPLEMMGDDDPFIVLNRIKETYRPELKEDEIKTSAWNEYSNDETSIKNRTKYLENLFLLSKIKYLFVHVINSIIDTANFYDLINDNRSKYEKFVSYNRLQDRPKEDTQIFDFVLLMWIESFFKVFIRTSKRSSNYAYETYGFHPELYRIYRSSSLQDFLETTTLLVELEIDRKYNEYQKKFTFSYLGIRTRAENLEKKLQPITDAIKEFSILYPNLLERYYTKRTGCLAGFKYKKHKYAALSGVIIPGENDIEKFLLNKYGITLIKLSDDVRYYFTNSQYITYFDFKNWFSKEKNDSNDYKRMFSCCEKKLLVVIYHLRYSDDDCKLYITREPCPMCVTAIKEAETQYNVSINVKYVIREKSELVDKPKYKELAKKISKSTL